MLQNAPLYPRILPPRNLPFVHLNPKVLAEQRAQPQEEWEQREEEAMAEQAQEQENELCEQALLEQAEDREFMEETSQEKKGRTEL